MEIACSIKDSIVECADSWDDLLPEGHHLRSRHLRAFELSGVANVTPAYIQVFHKAQLIGLLYLQQFVFTHEHLNFAEPRSIWSRCLQALLPPKLPILVCGHLFRIDFPGFYFTHAVSPAVLFQALGLYLKKEKCSRPFGIMVKDCERLYTRDELASFGYKFFDGDVTMELQRRVHWHSFDDYLNDLNKNYLQRARKVRSAFEGVQRVEFSAAEILQHAEELEKLYTNVVDKQFIKLGIVNAQYFYELKNDLADKFVFYALYELGVMVGFYTLIFYDRTMETHYIGLDYEANQRAKLYFNILFLSAETMIAHQLDSLELGRTAREAKVNLGALPKQIFNYTRVSNPLVRITLHYFLKRFNASARSAQLERNPLR